jgi:hypothetical protein
MDELWLALCRILAQISWGIKDGTFDQSHCSCKPNASNPLSPSRLDSPQTKSYRSITNHKMNVGHHCGIGLHAELEKIYKLLAIDLAFLVQLFSPKPPDQQPSSITSDCCSSFSSSPNGSTR